MHDSECLEDGKYKYSSMHKTDYYQKTGINSHNKNLLERKTENPEIINIETEMGKHGGWRCRTKEGYRDLLCQYINM